MKCVYLSMDSLEDFVSDADLTVPAMEALGWSVEKRSWRDSSVDWDTIDLVYVCTPWDYHEHLEEFMQVLVVVPGGTHIDEIDRVPVNGAVAPR